MSPSTAHSRMTQCRICDALVPVSTLSEHLLADARMLRLIKATRPELSRQECEEYLQGINGTRPRFQDH